MSERLLEEGELEAAIEKALIERQPSGSGYATIAKAQDARSYPIGYADGGAARDVAWATWLKEVCEENRLDRRIIKTIYNEALAQLKARKETK